MWFAYVLQASEFKKSEEGVKVPNRVEAVIDKPLLIKE